MSLKRRPHLGRVGHGLGAALVATLASLALSAPASAAIGLSDPCGAAVDVFGHAYVADYYHHAVVMPQVVVPDKTDPKKEALFRIEGLAMPGFPLASPCGLAVDANGALYTNFWHGPVAKYTPSFFPFFGAPEPEPTYFEEGAINPRIATGIALEPSSEKLFVNHRTSVAVYPAGAGPAAVPLMEIGSGSLVDSYGVAVSGFADTKGWVYAADAASDTVKVYDPTVSTTAPVEEIDGANTPAGRFVSLADSSLAISQNNGHLFVADNLQPGFEHPAGAVYEFNAKGVFRGKLASVVDGEPVGIAIDESQAPEPGKIYVTSGNGPTDVVPPASEGTDSLLTFLPTGEGQTLNVTIAGPGEGTVTSNPAGINCPGGCEAELNSGSEVALTATPKAGSAFAGWSGACTGNGACKVVLSAAAGVQAEFIPAPPLMSVAPGTGADSALNAVSGTALASPAALKLGRPSAQNAGVALPATAPGPGTLTATAPGLKPATASFAKAGTATLRLRLNTAGRRALARSKSGRLAKRVRVSFRPSSGGTASVVTKTVTFKH